MLPPNNKLIICIPTRNRSELACNAIRSVLDQRECAINILVSDNSTDDVEIDTLAQFCDKLNDPRVRYVRPPAPLAMSAHWNWLVENALAHDASHVAFLTDRMIIKRGELKAVYEIVAHYPDKIVCYMHDRIEDHRNPVKLYQNPWTGHLFLVQSSLLLNLSAQSVMSDASCPRLLNCVVPRTTLEAIRGRFGTICDSIAPDWNFCYRALALIDSLLFYDRSVLIHYATGQSNGESQSRNVMTSAFRDFLANLGSRQLNFATPIPEVVTVWNAIINEYCAVKQATGSSKFPELDLQKYMGALAVGVGWIEDPEKRARSRAILVAHGWQECAGNDALNSNALMPSASLSWRVCRSMGKVWRRTVLLAKGRAIQPVWIFLSAFGVHPPDENEFVFSSTEDAMSYAQRFPRLPNKDWRLRLPRHEFKGSIALVNPAIAAREERLMWHIGRLLDKSHLWKSFLRFLDRHVVWRFD